MIEEILYAKEKQLINKKIEIEKSYDTSDRDTRKIYDKMLELIEIELNLIYSYIPKKETIKSK